MPNVLMYFDAKLHVRLKTIVYEKSLRVRSISYWIFLKEKMKKWIEDINCKIAHKNQSYIDCAQKYKICGIYLQK